MIMYGSKKESEDIQSIEKKYPEDEIINPSQIQPESPNDPMDTYLKAVKKCKFLIVRKIVGK